MVPGHTHFNPDRAFAWITNLMKRWNAVYTPQGVLAIYKELKGNQKVNSKLITSFYKWREYFESLITMSSQKKNCGI
jgi:hypothetical protein